MKLNVCVAFFFVITKTVLGLNEIQKGIIEANFIADGVGCLKDYPLTLSDIRSFKNKTLPEGENAKCFAQCLFQKIGIMDAMGKISADDTQESAIRIFMNNEDHLTNVDQVIQACSHVNEQEFSEEELKSCDRAKLAFKCLVENAPNFGFNLDI